MEVFINDFMREQRNIHILYSYGKMEEYLLQVVNFIKEGIFAKEHVILVENDRLYPMIYKMLQSQLTEEQQKMLHFENSLSFYRSSGSYHPPAIKAYFERMVAPFVSKDIKFRSWAHVEWATMQEPWFLVEELEEMIDSAVNIIQFPLICAYQAERMPEVLQKALVRTHPYILSDEGLLISEAYAK